MDLIEYLTELLFSLLLPLLHAVWQLLVPPWLSAPARDAQRQQVEEEATERALATGAAPSTPLPVAAAAVSPAAAAPSPVRFRQATAYVAWLQQCAQQEYQAALAVASTAQLSW